MKAAIIILSDPKSGSEESLGRVFNALAAAYDFKQRGDEVTVRFQGTGTFESHVLCPPYDSALGGVERCDRVTGRMERPPEGP